MSSQSCQGRTDNSDHRINDANRSQLEVNRLDGVKYTAAHLMNVLNVGRHSSGLSSEAASNPR